MGGFEPATVGSLATAIDHYPRNQFKFELVWKHVIDKNCEFFR